MKIRLLVDPILPTDPTNDPSPAALEALRQRMIADQLSVLPSTLRALKASRGYAVQLPWSDDPSTYRWKLPAGTPGRGIDVDGSWPSRTVLLLRLPSPGSTN